MDELWQILMFFMIKLMKREKVAHGKPVWICVTVVVGYSRW